MMKELTANQPHRVIKLMSAEAILQNGSYTTEEVDIATLRGFLALQWEVTGAGTCRFEVLSTINGKDYLDVNADVANNQTATAGPGSDGKNAASVIFIPSSAVKVKVTEVNVGAVAVSLWIKGY